MLIDQEKKHSLPLNELNVIFLAKKGPTFKLFFYLCTVTENCNMYETKQFPILDFSFVL